MTPSSLRKIALNCKRHIFTCKRKEVRSLLSGIVYNKWQFLQEFVVLSWAGIFYLGRWAETGSCYVDQASFEQWGWRGRGQVILETQPYTARSQARVWPIHLVWGFGWSCYVLRVLHLHIHIHAFMSILLILIQHLRFLQTLPLSMSCLLQWWEIWFSYPKYI
jgi:hypothetical protein